MILSNKQKSSIVKTLQSELSAEYSVSYDECGVYVEVDTYDVAVLRNTGKTYGVDLKVIERLEEISK